MIPWLFDRLINYKYKIYYKRKIACDRNKRQHQHHISSERFTQTFNKPYNIYTYHFFAEIISKNYIGDTAVKSSISIAQVLLKLVDKMTQSTLVL